MEETNSRTQKQQIQKQLSPTHSGSGGLRGGGIRPRLSIRDETLVNFGKKLEKSYRPNFAFLSGYNSYCINNKHNLS
uniref:Uncharacterized protein n=1 Tax=Meloidogyne enterolobii TaxID=390850 RepID=A0A6V7Y950_MELEN|nr:unnamed protein product [Meloidogyne enterolobii]